MSATEQAGDLAAHLGGPPAAGRGRAPRAGNGFATAALALGAAGVSLVTIVPALVCGVVGLRRAAALRGPGRLRSWAGLALAALWATTAAYLVPHLIRASDPGCTAYKGLALTAYNRVAGDLSGQRAGPLTLDLSQAITALDAARAQSRDRATSRDLSLLADQLRAVLGDISAGKVVPGTAMAALNTDAERADSGCGTLRF
jgi:hypothetical protein